MSDLSWCTYCDNAISHYSESLYCSEQCLRADALRNHPLLGYTYPEFVDFPRPYPKQQQQQQGLPMEPSLSRSAQRNSSDSIHTLPTLSTSHSSCQTSPTLSSYDTSSTTPPPLQLPPAMSKSSSSSHSIPSFLWTGASTATTALSRPLMAEYRPIH